jgi:hypothetical protein
MKTVLLLLGLTLANVATGAVARFTNVNDVVLGLEFSEASVVAGERLPGRMIISNASRFELRYPWFTAPGARDTTIGDFVVADEGGYLMRKAVPVTEWETSGTGRTLHFRPGHAEMFGGDVVYGYSLTNAGTYFVKAIAVVPMTNQPALDKVAGETMVIETPTVEITIIPRPQTMSTPEPLYRSIRPGQDLAAVNQAIAANMGAFPPLRITYPKPDPIAPVPRVAPGEARPALPQSVQNQLANGSSATTGRTGAKEEARGILFGLIAVLVSGGLVVYLIWSRRKHG